MFPDMYQDPSSCFEATFVLLIASDVPGHLIRPVGRIGLRLSVMTWASVPEASPDFDGDPGWPEHNVSRPRHPWDGAGAYPVAQPKCVKQPP